VAVQQAEMERAGTPPDLVVETVSQPTPEESSRQGAAGNQETVRHALGAVARGAVRQVERQLPSLIVAALGMLFSQAVENAVRQRLDEAIHAAMAGAFEALSDVPAGAEVQREAEDVARSVMHDILSSLFEGAIRAELEARGRVVAEALLRGDTEAAQEVIKPALAATLHDALEIVKNHRGELSRAVLAVLAKATKDVAVNAIESGAGEAVAEPAKAVAEAAAKVEPDTVEKRQQTVRRDSRPMKKKLDDGGRSIRDQLAGIGDTLRTQIEQETRGLKDRITDGAQSGAKGGMRNGKLGRPPSARSSNRSPLGRPPSRRPPRRRPPAR
jgi:hypothetical protein